MSRDYLIYFIAKYSIPSNVVRLMFNKTNNFNTEFVLKTPPIVVYIYPSMSI